MYSLNCLTELHSSFFFSQKTATKNYSSYGLVIISEAVFFVKLPGNKILIKMSSLLRQKKSSRVIISDKCIFQQDNCPAHTAHRVREWFADRNVNVLD
jgi:hypothetical protein